MMNDLIFYIQQYSDRYSLFIPLGVIGLWRWTVWLLKRTVGRFYKPVTSTYNAPVSIVTPVYNEDPKLFTKALKTWKDNNPHEIIAVIDFTDKTCISIFKKFAKTYSGAKLIITKVPGKRPALANGIKKATGEIVALVDSDTVWEKDVIKNGLPPFIDPKVAGVGTYQSVLKPKTLAQRFFDTQLDLRYMDEFPFMAAAGDALVCLSGRTAFYRRETLLPLLHDLVHETFLGKPVISGDDKRLTYLVLAHGWKVKFQSNSIVHTPGMKNLAFYFKQRLRWTRNSLRADMKAMSEGWTWKHRALAFYQLDKVVQTFALVLSPIYFIIALATKLWLAAAVIFVWWFISRAIKMSPHLRKKPLDILILPHYILFSFILAVIKIYAFFTLNTQGWITRWDKSRLPRFTFFQTLPSAAATIIFLVALASGVYFMKLHTYFIPQEKQQQLIARTLPAASKITYASMTEPAPKDMMIKRYEVQPGDSIGSIAGKFSLSGDMLLAANISHLTNWNRIEPGLILNIPGKDITIKPSPNQFNYLRIYSDPLRITREEATNTIMVFGRGQRVTLREIASRVGPQYLEEVEPKIWHLKSTLYIRSGVTLSLDKEEVAWLRLQSNKDGYVVLRGVNSNIIVNGVKITSWDETANTYDLDYKDGRSFILVKDGSRMDFNESELAYLGFPRTPEFTLSPYGVSWRMSNGKLGTLLLTGEVTNTKFHHNYFGAYTFGATGMTWKGNEFYDNIVYGLDPHDDSNGFLVENNKAYNNGTHGIIFSKRCVNNTIRNNISYNNKLHGIMLHEESNNNIIEGNILHDNNDGIAIWSSHNNIVRNNTITNNKNGVRANAKSHDNLIEKNKITRSSQYGVYFYTKAQNNIVRDNLITDSYAAVYIKANNNQIYKNTITHNNIGVYFLEDASHNVLAENHITFNKTYGIYSKIQENYQNSRGENVLYRNRKDIVAKDFQPETTELSALP